MMPPGTLRCLGRMSISPLHIVGLSEAHGCNSSTWEVEAGGSQWVLGQPRLHSETPPHKAWNSVWTNSQETNKDNPLNTYTNMYMRLQLLRPHLTGYLSRPLKSTLLLNFWRIFNTMATFLHFFKLVLTTCHLSLLLGLRSMPPAACCMHPEPRRISSMGRGLTSTGWAGKGGSHLQFQPSGSCGLRTAVKSRTTWAA